MNADTPLLETQSLSKIFDAGEDSIQPLQSIDFIAKSGNFIAIMGPSGSGKTTLLNLMAGLDKPTDGKVLFEGKDVVQMSEKELTNFRRHSLGFVFQSFMLMPLLSAFENVELVLRIAGVGASQRKDRTSKALEMVGMGHRMSHRPHELSGGEKQRVAIARATVSDPYIIFADEPTAELDSINAQAIFSIFKQLTIEKGMTVITTTHDATLIDMASEVYELRDGVLHRKPMDD